MKSGTRTLGDLGEDAVLARITRDLAMGTDVRVGPGDDCAVVGAPRDRWWHLLKTDAVVEGVHFLAETDARRVGWKALARAISDIAAMGGIPQHALIAVAANRCVEVKWIDHLYRGLLRAAERFGISIVGGELSRSPGPVFVNVTLTGRVERKRCILRSGGKPGDLLFVTGTLGGSLKGKHLDFIPRLEEARWLTEYFRPSAMMDLSDGLAADLPRMAAASQCGFRMEETSIPRTHGCSSKQALTDGEDFELLFTIAPAKATMLATQWKRKFPQVLLSRIGVFTEPADGGRSLGKGIHGHDHFA